MSISQALLPEFDQEMANTRKVLDRIPEDKLDWKAHPKSNTIGWVSKHLADLPSWATETMKHESLDVAPPGGEPFKLPEAKTKQAILELFDKNVASARAAINAASDADYMKTWTLLKGGQKIFAMPRVAVVRSMVLNHSIHHRGHLCVYLRLNNVPVPALYGPSGDEGSF
ncbi:MAG TPA: DinB family protein [Planctomycetaceae bacterium]|jgi:uncharacterized damage-inducible protein DinB|nr:DinB family protein [Planctomycetaceae bacterium]